MSDDPHPVSLYENLFDELPIGCHEIDSEGRIRRVNAKELEILNRTRDQMVGRFIWDFVVEGERSAYRGEVLRTVAGLSSINGEFCRTFERPDGTTVPMSIRDAIKCDSLAGTTTMLSTLQDISVDREIDLALKDPGAMHLHFAVPVYVVRKNRELKFTFGNQRFCDEVKTTPAQLVGKSDLDFYPQDVAEKFRKDDLKVFREGIRLQTLEINHPLKGQRHDVQVIKVPSKKNSAGEITEIQIVFWDVLERESVLNQLKNAATEATEAYRRIFENSVIGVFQSTPGGRYLKVNKALVKMSGYSTEEFLEMDVENIYFDSNKRRSFMKLMEDKGHVENLEYRIRCKDGSPLWISEFAQAIKDPSGNVVLFEGFVENIHQRKMVEGKAERMQKLSEIERKLAQRFQASLNLDELAVLQLEVRRVLCALTASDGLGAHRAIFFQLVDDVFEGLCGVGPSTLTEAAEYAKGVGSGQIDFDTAMAGMEESSFAHPDRLHGEVLRTRFPTSLLGRETIEVMNSRKGTMINVTECARSEAKFFFLEHDIKRALVFPIEEHGKLRGLLLLDCLYPNCAFEIDPDEAMMFAHLLPGLMSRAEYIREKRRNVERAIFHGIGAEMLFLEGSSRVLNREELSTKGRGALAAINGVMGRVRSKLRTFLGTGGKPRIQTAKIDVNSLIREYYKKRGDGDSAIHIRLHFGAEHQFVIVDPETFSLILDELVNNAYARRRDNVPAELSIASETCVTPQIREGAILDVNRTYARISVSDNGLGVSAEIRPRLFEEYVTDSPSGLGLGLAWVRVTLRSQFGEILEASANGQGAKFEIYLPAC